LQILVTCMYTCLQLSYTVWLYNYDSS
jgi:hypothetical protein